MKNKISKIISSNLFYEIIVGIIVTGAVFAVFKIVPKVSISKQPIQDENLLSVAESQTEIRDLEEKTSRGNDEIRTNTQDSTSENVEIQGIKEESKSNAEEVETSDKKLENIDISEKKSEEIKNSEKKSEKDENLSNSKKEDTTKYISIKEVKISKDMDLSKRTGLSREDFIKLISGVKYDTSGFFEDNAGTIYDLCEKYNINEIFFCGLISAESAWNIAQNHRNAHNYISLMKNGKLIHYDSVYEGLEVAAQKLHNNYLTSGGKFYHGKTLSGVQKCFCPSSSWVDLVYGRMKQIV